MKPVIVLPVTAVLVAAAAGLAFFAIGRPVAPASPTPELPAAAAAATWTPAPPPVSPISLLEVPAVTSPPAAPAAAVTPEAYTYTVRQVLPHNPNAFTQGLVYAGGHFYEGTGRYGQSSLRKVDPATGTVLQLHELAEEYFGEGITLFDDKIYQLTWKNGTGFVYDAATFAELRRFTYATEGWGITHDGSQLIVSDGSAFIYFWDPETLQETGRIEVTLDGAPVYRLNELEYIEGAIFANVWMTDVIVRIDPATGVVTGLIDLSGLLGQAPETATAADVLNGIAYDAANQRLFVTGKLWPYLFEIALTGVE